MARVGDKSATEIGHYSEAELHVINDFLTRMEGITREEANALRGEQGSAANATSEHTAPVGGLSHARLLFKTGAHELLLHGVTDIEDLYRATFSGRVPQVRLRDGIVTIGYKRGWKWDWLERRTDVRLNAALPWDIEIVGGAGKLQGKFTKLDLRSSELTGGVDQFRLTLGQPSGDVPIRFTRGANNLRIERPRGVHVRLTLDEGAGRIDFDEQRLSGPASHTILGTTGIADATDRYLIEITGGAGKITVTEVD